MSRERSTDDVKIEQQAPINFDNLKDREPEIVKAENVSAEYADELAFNEEPVTIMIAPEASRKAAGWVQTWSNGECKYLVNGKWVESKDGYLPVNQKITIKRRLLEVLLRARITRISTDHNAVDHQGNPVNQELRDTSMVNPIQILRDPSPRSEAWFNEVMRRNF